MNILKLESKVRELGCDSENLLVFRKWAKTVFVQYKKIWNLKNRI